jgi:hypothetical protein
VKIERPGFPDLFFIFAHHNGGIFNIIIVLASLFEPLMDADGNKKWFKADPHRYY